MTPSIKFVVAIVFRLLSYFKESGPNNDPYNTDAMIPLVLPTEIPRKKLGSLTYNNSNQTYAVVDTTLRN